MSSQLTYSQVSNILFDLLPTAFSRVISAITIASCIFINYVFNDLVSLMPYTLEANKVLTKVLILVAIFALGSFVILCHMIKEHKRLAHEIKDLSINSFLSNPVKYRYK